MIGIAEVVLILTIIVFLYVCYRLFNFLKVLIMNKNK